MVSCRDGWSNHEILPVTSVSPRSSKEALDARFVFAGLSLYHPLDVDTACLKILYWAAEIFLLSPSSPSSWEMSLGLRVHGRGEVEWRLVSCRRLYWRGSGQWWTRSGFPGLAAMSHGHPGLSHGSLDFSLGLPGPPEKRTDGTLWSMEKPLWRLRYSLWSSSRRGWSPVGWVMSGSRSCWLVWRTGWSNWNTGLVHPTL